MLVHDKHRQFKSQLSGTDMIDNTPCLKFQIEESRNCEVLQ